MRDLLLNLLIQEERVAGVCSGCREVVLEQSVGSRGGVVERVARGQDFYWLVAFKDARVFIGS